MRVHEMSGNTGPTKYMFIMANDWIFDDIGTNTTVQARTNGILKQFIFVCDPVSHNDDAIFCNLHVKDI